MLLIGYPYRDRTISVVAAFAEGRKGTVVNVRETSPGQVMTQMLLGNRLQQAIYSEAELPVIWGSGIQCTD